MDPIIDWASVEGEMTVGWFASLHGHLYGFSLVNGEEAFCFFQGYCDAKIRQLVMSDGSPPTKMLLEIHYRAEGFRGLLGVARRLELGRC